MQHSRGAARFTYRVAGLLGALCLLPGAAAADLQGRWAGYWDCGEKANRQFFLLDIAGNSARFENPLGVLTVAGTVGGDSIDLKLEEWVTPAPRGANTVTGISGSYQSAAEVLTGEVQATGSLQCRAAGGGRGTAAAPASPFPRFIAAKVGAVPEPRENPDGLLFQVTDNVRSGRKLTPAQCSRYAEFLASGEVRGSPVSRRTKLHTAVLNADLMLEVLGHDLNSWTAADFPRMRAISGACKQILMKSGNADLIQQASAIRVWKPVPLTLDRVRQQQRWIYAMVSQYVEAVEPLPTIAMRIDEGLYETGSVTTAAASTPVAAAEGLAGLWHGFFQCDTGEHYLRLDLKSSASQVEGTIDFAGGMDILALRGALHVKGSESASGQFELKPTEWVHKPDRGVSIGLKGTRSDDRIQGQVTGNGACSSFQGRRLLLTRLPKNPDGLLFKVVKRNTSQLTMADCRRFGEWIVTGERIYVGQRQFNTIALDQAAANAVLGKNELTWAEADRERFNALSGFCARQLIASTDTADQELVARVADWSAPPFGAPISNYMLDAWLLKDMVVLVTTEGEELAAAQLEELSAAPGEFPSIDRANVMLHGLAKKEGRFKYLPVERLAEHRDDLLAARTALGERTALALATAYADFPQTFEGFRDMAAESKKQQQALKDGGVPEAAASLEQLYGKEASRRGSKLLPEMMARHRVVLEGELADSGYGKMPAMHTIDQERNDLAEYWTPPNGSPLAVEYQAFLRERDATANAMVTRSLARLMKWVEKMPPSKSANRALTDFVRATFRGDQVPPEFDELRKAINAKKADYNPLRFARPDIAAALLRGHWVEVQFRGLENLAWYGTAMDRLRQKCPTEVEGMKHKGAVNGFYLHAGQDAVERIMRGEFSSPAEQARVFLMGMNAIFNSPGCRVDIFGNVTTDCTTEEEAAASMKALMSSGPGSTDASKLLKGGCAGTTREFLGQLGEFASLRPLSASFAPIGITKPWLYVGNN